MKAGLKFTKMQGLGNDFILVDKDEIKKYGMPYNELAKKICDRKFGIGADGLIVVNPDDYQDNAHLNTDTNWRIFNSDGSEPQMCGNGIRCFAKYVYEKGLVNKKKFTVQTLAGVIIPEIQENGEVKVNMGEPILDAKKIPTTGINSEKVINFPIKIKDKEFNITTVSMGNPHCIIFSNEDTAELARKYGPEIETSKWFPEKTNVEFVKIFSRDNILIDVWERGCGITLACGTGACASVVAAILNNLTDTTVIANLPGGSLKIEWERDSNKIFMTGDSKFVFQGEYFI